MCQEFLECRISYPVARWLSIHTSPLRPSVSPDRGESARRRIDLPSLMTKSNSIHFHTIPKSSVSTTTVRVLWLLWHHEIFRNQTKNVEWWVVAIAAFHRPEAASCGTLESLCIISKPKNSGSQQVEDVHLYVHLYIYNIYIHIQYIYIDTLLPYLFYIYARQESGSKSWSKSWSKKLRTTLRLEPTTQARQAWESRSLLGSLHCLQISAISIVCFLTVMLNDAYI